MCRYATTRYKKHYACFACRKAFKRRNKADVDQGGEEHPARCPQCALLMADMGLDFAPPPTDDRKAWSTLSALYEVGETFHSCGCGGPGYRPRDPALLTAFFAERSDVYRRQLVAWLDEVPTSVARATTRRAAISEWGARIARLELASARPLRR
jgi:hypothetical protein